MGHHFIYGLLLWSAILSYGATKKPNILMIVADDMGFNDASFHGCQQIPTPNLDMLAKSGIILNRYYALPSCTPTRSAIMTGRYPIHTGMQTGTIYAASPWALGLEEKILPQYLKELGYKTHAIGKWHLGFMAKEYTPTHRGFDSFFGYYGGQADYWDHSLESNGYWGLDLHRDTPQSSEVVTTQWGNYSSNMYALEAIDLINNHENGESFFIYLAFQAVHSANMVEYPLQAPQYWLGKLQHIKHPGRRHYAAMIASMDHNIGQVYKALVNKGISDETIIVFTSDNGGPANGLDMNWATNFPLRGAKTTVYEGGVRVAGFINSKMLQTPGVSYDLFHVSDWLPTLMTAIGGHLTNITSLDGMSMWDTLKYGTKSPRTEVLVNIETGATPKAALISGEWKLVNQSHWYDGWYPPPEVTLEEFKSSVNDAQIRCADPPKDIKPCGGKAFKPCLFKIKEDPCELNDVSDKFPEIYKLMLHKLEGYKRTMVKARQNTSTDPEADPRKHNGVWVPWKKVEREDTLSKMYSLFESPLTLFWSYLFQ